MTRPHRTRLQALLLATVLVAGGIVLPAYDAAFYHNGQPAQNGPVRFEPGETGTAHILLCALGPRFNHTRGPLPGANPIGSHCPEAPVAPPVHQAVAPAAPPSSLQHSRAPPADTA